MRAQAEELLECPVCGAKLWERRPPFRSGPNSFNCSECGSKLRFSARSQKRILYVVIALCVVGPAAVYARDFFGPLASIIAVFAGAAVVLGMLVWQGRVPQLEEDK